MTKKKKTSKTKSAKKPIDFKESVYKKLGKKPQSSVDIAAKLGLVNDDGSVKPSGAAKVRRALQALVAEKPPRTVHSGAYKTSAYRLP